MQIMLLAALVLRPLPESVVDQVGAWRTELCVDESLIGVAREIRVRLTRARRHRLRAERLHVRVAT